MWLPRSWSDDRETLKRSAFLLQKHYVWQAVIFCVNAVITFDNSPQSGGPQILTDEHRSELRSEDTALQFFLICFIRVQLWLLLRPVVMKRSP